MGLGVTRDRSGGLRIGLIAPPWVPVPPPVYGGTEVVVEVLARGLRAAGADVVLFTTGDATCPVTRRWRYPTALGTSAAPHGEAAHVERAYAELADVDLIHDHTLQGPARHELHPPGVPVVTTVHGPFTPELRAHYAAVAAGGVAVVAISHAQRRDAPEVPVAAVIHHGIDVSAFPLGRGQGGYVLFLGRMSPDKGAHRAIAVARAAGRRIVLAAKMHEPEEHEYFRAQVEPLLDGDAVFVGEVGGRAKLDLLAGAEALVNPIRWAEPFGLVMIESLACGTPVLAYSEGSAPEIIADGETGYLCLDEDDMAARLRQVPRLSRGACRRSVVARFTAARMVDDHLALYARLLGDGAVVDLDDPPAPDPAADAPELRRTAAS